MTLFPKLRMTVADVKKTIRGRRLASGAYGVVYQHRLFRDRVIKCVEFGVDIAYQDFLKIVMKHPVRGFPKIYSVFVVKPDPKSSDQTWEILCVVMEKLKRNRKADRLSRTSVAYSCKTPHFKDALKEHDPALSKQKPFVEAMGILCKSRLFAKHSNDLHGANIMFRGKTAVITDPAC